MQRYLIRRVLEIIPTIFILTLIVFFVIRLKGDPIAQLAPFDLNQEEIEMLRSAYGLDQPLHIQYWKFLSKLVVGDFGRSMRYHAPAMPIVLERIPATLELAFAALIFSLVISLPLGITSALKPNSLLDLVATTFSAIGRAMPSYWLGIMLILFLAVAYPIFPVSGRDKPGSIILPMVTLGLGLATTLTRIIRSSMLEVVRQDYITTARSKGLHDRVILIKHALRNALIPVITVFALQMAWLFSGVVIVETVFAWPGMGRLLVKAVQTRDMAVVQAGIFIAAMAVLIINLLTDVIYTVVDPRISYD
ncbi:MAG: ABC transporter permease [Chloroflexi bacterium]|nr:ABC transporter permease [Chloroflexota bacterium]